MILINSIVENSDRRAGTVQRTGDLRKAFGGPDLIKARGVVEILIPEIASGSPATTAVSTTTTAAAG
jgi:hypothetical protein